jgi:hypothetical protein
MSEKYVTFKAGDWDEFIRWLNSTDIHQGGLDGHDILDAIPEALADAEVFRHQDLVAAPIFYAASAIYQSYLELAFEHLITEQRIYMQDVVDHFFEAAEKSTGLPSRKLPDP